MRLSFREPGTYGLPFSMLIREHDAVLVPSLSDEQPRIIFDALSQAVPVIASDTGGISQVIEPDRTARLVVPGDVPSLAEAMVWAGQNRPTLRAMGLRGVAAARGHSHRAMHQTRSAILRQMLEKFVFTNRDKHRSDCRDG